MEPINQLNMAIMDTIMGMRLKAPNYDISPDAPIAITCHPELTEAMRAHLDEYPIENIHLMSDEKIPTKKGKSGNQHSEIEFQFLVEIEEEEE